MNKKSLLIFPICLLLAGCKIDIFGKTIKIFEKDNKETTQKEEQKEELPDEGENKPVTPEGTDTHATAFASSTTANHPFYLKVGETKEISVSLSPSPTKDDEKYFTWTLDGNHITYEVSENTRKATITGASEGTSKLTVTNTYNEILSRTYTIKVINFDEDKDYLWQYQSSDRAQFGYVYQEKPEGDTEGDVLLNGMPWHFERSRATSLQSSMGAVGFGKGKAPEEHIHFESEVNRVVNNFTIEAASANSLAKMTVKIGDTIYINDVTVPKDNYDVIGTLVSDSVTGVKGKIEIDITTPSYEVGREDWDPNYKAPGAFYLKSILINFDESVPAKTMSLIKNIDDIVDGGRYLILGSTSAGYGALDGTLGSGTKDNPLFLQDFVLNDTVEVSGTFDKYGFVASIDENDKLDFTADTGIKIGLTNSGGLSTTKSPALLGWDYELDSSNHLEMSMTDPSDDSKHRHFGANDSTGKFSAYASAKNNIYLYKF